MFAAMLWKKKISSDYGTFLLIFKFAILIRESSSFILFDSFKSSFKDIRIELFMKLLAKSSSGFESAESLEKLFFVKFINIQAEIADVLLHN